MIEKEEDAAEEETKEAKKEKVDMKGQMCVKEESVEKNCLKENWVPSRAEEGKCREQKKMKREEDSGKRDRAEKVITELCLHSENLFFFLLYSLLSV